MSEHEDRTLVNSQQTPSPSDSPVLLGDGDEICLLHWDDTLVHGVWYVAGPGNDFVLAAYSQRDVDEFITEQGMSWRPLNDVEIEVCQLGTRVVLQPDVVTTDIDVWSADDIQNAEALWHTEYQPPCQDHHCRVLESRVLDKDKRIPAGSWVQVVDATTKKP